MPLHSISSTDQIYYLHHPEQSPGKATFVFFNALTGDTNAWESSIAPKLRQEGFGTLSFDYRGQTQSVFSPQNPINSQIIVDDSMRMLQKVAPSTPIFVGLSIGGLYAARAWLAGAAADKLVLLNTLRKDGPRLQWIGDALVRAVRVGGLELFRDMFLPLLMNETWQEAHRKDFLQTPPAYEPLPRQSGTYKLLAEAGPSADWDLPYERLDLPTLVVTGLQDHVFLNPKVVDALFARLPRGTRIDMAEAGHLIPAEHPDRLCTILAEFASSKEEK
jgi:pimeloyl-ACP methyl ester carboxylesterase